MSSDTEWDNDSHAGEGLQGIHLKVSPPLARAFQRCCWMIIHETGRSQLDIMEEMVQDFLRKHGC